MPSKKLSMYLNSDSGMHLAVSPYPTEYVHTHLPVIECNKNRVNEYYI